MPFASSTRRRVFVVYAVLSFGLRFGLFVLICVLVALALVCVLVSSSVFVVVAVLCVSVLAERMFWLRLGFGLHIDDVILID